MLRRLMLASRAMMMRRRGHWQGPLFLAWIALLAACGGEGAAPAPGFGPSAPPPNTPPPNTPVPAPAPDVSAPLPSGGAGDSPSNAEPSNAEPVNSASGNAPPAGNPDTTSEPTPSEPAPSEPAPSEPTLPEPEPEASSPLTLYLAGDSIVQTYADSASDSDQAGWGQMLGGFFDAEVTVNNRAIGGRTARRFIDEGRLDAIVAELEPGDYLLVQFGTNDGNRTATYTIDGVVIPYFLEPSTDFRAYLQRYIDAARSRGATPVLVTPTPRNSAYCTGGNGTGAHAAAMNALGQEQGVPVVDLNARTVGYLREICPAPTPEDFFLLRGDGTVDGTHFQENGARILASFIADGLRDIGTPLAAHLRP
jgi:lysophospholipase L1-like esterase